MSLDAQIESSDLTYCTTLHYDTTTERSVQCACDKKSRVHFRLWPKKDILKKKGEKELTTPWRTQTHDPEIKSLMLYRLS